MRDAVHYLYALSDPELVLYWQAFGVYPTLDRRQRARLERAVAAAVGENVPKLMNLAERQTVGRVTPRPPKSKEVAA
jgi:hypothetical protein